MTKQAKTNNQTKTTIKASEWAKLGLAAGVVSVVAVLVVQFLAIALWPEIALFAPLDSYIRSVILFAWLVKRTANPVKTFIIISVVVLVISFIPDYILPVPDKTVLASTVAAFLHIVVAVPTVWILVSGYQQRIG